MKIPRSDLKGTTVLLIAIVLASALLLGCTQQGSPTIGKPEIREITHEWGAVTSSTTEIITKVKVYNPNPISLPLKDVLTEIYMNDIKMGEGSALKSEI
jgi:LEA14-like dessication related protein